MVDRCEEVGKTRTGISLSRLVDCEKAILGPADIRSIEYSLYEVASDRPRDAGLLQNRPSRGGQAHFAPRPSRRWCPPQNEPVPDDYGIGPKRPVAGHNGRRLRVGEVVFDELQTGDGWSVDNVGYNFRHRFSISGVGDACRQYEMHYELRYVITQTTGEKTDVCFRIRMVPT
jgi:hypothetical protein